MIDKACCNTSAIVLLCSEHAVFCLCDVSILVEDNGVAFIDLIGEVVAAAFVAVVVGTNLGIAGCFSLAVCYCLLQGVELRHLAALNVAIVIDAVFVLIHNRGAELQLPPVLIVVTSF